MRSEPASDSVVKHTKKERHEPLEKEQSAKHIRPVVLGTDVGRPKEKGSTYQEKGDEKPLEAVDELWNPDFRTPL